MKRRKRALKDLEEDIRDHIGSEAQENIERGMSPEEARYAAIRKFGNLTRIKEETYDVWNIVWLEQLLQDLRFAIRMLLKIPGFTFGAVLTLALGIGVNTSIFSVLYSMALRPLPVKNPASIVSVYEQFRGRYSRGVYGQPNLLSYPEYANYSNSNHVFSGLSAYADVSLSLSGANGQAIAGLLASCNYFDVLGGEMTRGRGLLQEDCRTQDPVAVISHRFWTSHLASNPAVLGTRLVLNRQTYTVVGVTAENFGGTELQVPDVWLPLTMASRLLPDEFGNRNWLALENVGWLNVVGRLKPGISHKRAEGELSVLAHRVDANYPGQQTIVVVNSGAYWNSPEMRRVGAWVATAMLGLAGVILGIACMNVMTLLLARATARYQEIGVRLALGASRMRLVRQLLTEILLLALLGGAASVIVARWVPPLLVTAVPEMPMSPQVNLTPNLAILTYAFLVSLAAAVVCGLAPTLQATNPAIITALKERRASISAGLWRSRLRSSLIVAQVAGCSLLLVAAALLARGLHRAQSTSPGFITKNVILVSLDLANNGYGEARAAAFERALRDRLAAVPGVTGVARAGVVPCLASNVTSVTIPGTKADSGSLPVWENTVSANYFQTMGIPLLRGRVFTEQEADAPGAVPAIISAAMAGRFWGETDPVGKQFLSGTTIYQVLGIVPDVQNVRLGQTDGPFFYAASGPDSELDAKIFVHTTGNSSVLETDVAQLTRQLDANVMASTERFDSALEKTMMPSRTLTLLVAVLGILAMVVAMVGVWGIVAYAASQRTHEIGIRKALGAYPRDILNLLLRHEVKLAAVGLAIGLVAGAGAAQLLSAAGLLFGLSAFDSTAYLMTAIAFSSATMLACYLPARRAMQVDPMVALRYD